MPNYCVDTTPGDDGEIVVHDMSPGKCSKLADVISPYELGWHGNCYSALAKAKLLFMQSNGCAECCPECHTVSASKGHDFKPSDF